MRLGVITLFPEMFQVITNYGVIGRSIRDGLICIKLWNPRTFLSEVCRKVDDRPYGGGPGMLMTFPPLKKAINYAKVELGNNNTKVIYLSPQGKKINQKLICKLIHEACPLILVCGRYLGVDERLIKTEIDEEWSIGDYILSGGELAAMVLIDVMSRLLPGVLKNKLSIASDSFAAGRLDCPYYSRPRSFDGIQVPSVLLSGNHSNIFQWRLKQALGNTWLKRPDLLNDMMLTNSEQRLLYEFKKEYLLSLRGQNK